MELKRVKEKQRGIGFLELIFALAIIAVLLMLATRYYLATDTHKNNQSVTQTLITSIKDVV